MFPIAKMNLHRLNAVRLPKVKDLYQRVGRCEPSIQADFTGPMFPARENDKLKIVLDEARSIASQSPED